MKTKKSVAIVLGLMGFSVVNSIAYADVAPPGDYVESCTIEKTCPEGQECLACPGSYKDYTDTPYCEKTYSGSGYSKACRSWGGSAWTEIWCRSVSSSQDGAPQSGDLDGGEAIQVVRCPNATTDGSVALADASVTPEASVTPADASVTPTDASVAPTDASVTPAEASVVPTDAHVVTTDASEAPADASLATAQVNGATADASVETPDTKQPSHSKSDSLCSVGTVLTGENGSTALNAIVLIGLIVTIRVRRFKRITSERT
jgi:hypothetical protein